MIRDMLQSFADLASPPSDTAFTQEDRQIVERVEDFLAKGLDLKRWWDRKRVTQDFEDRFELAFTYNRPDVSYGFFDRARVQGQELPVLGNYQTMFYDQPKSPAADQRSAQYLDAQIREFVLRYFMHVSDFRDPQPFTEGDPSPPLFLRPLSWCTGRDVQRIGFGYSQLFYKRAGSGEIGKFPESRRYAIVDLRDIGPKYRWIVLRVKIFDFSFVIRPFGAAAPSVTVPLNEESLLVLNRDFVLDENGPRPGDLGRYGFGYAFIKNPSEGLLGWGPGRFDAAMQTIHFRVLHNGRTRVDMAFVANRPTSIANVSLNPVQWGCDFLDVASGGAASALTAPVRAMSERLPAVGGFRFDPVFGFVALANLFTGGLAARELCISRRQLEKRLILQHFMKHYQAVAGSIQTWRQIRDWLDERSLPRWVVTGESA